MVGRIQKNERVMKIVFFVCACISIAAVILICLFLFTNGIPAIVKIGVPEFLSGMKWKPQQDIYGILPMIIGSLYVTAGAVLIGIPVGLFAAVFLAYFCPERLRRLLKPAVNLLAGIPSVIYGFFGLTVLVPAIQAVAGGSGKGVLTVSVVLGIMVLPTIISVSEDALRSVPDGYLEGALALGATRERSVFRVVLPAARSGIAAGAVLGLGRAIGEAMAVSMVAGNQAVIPKGLLSGVRTLTANIVLEMGYAAELHREALIGTAVVLFVFILIINLMFSLIRGK